MVSTLFAGFGSKGVTVIRGATLVLFRWGEDVHDGSLSTDVRIDGCG